MGSLFCFVTVVILMYLVLDFALHHILQKKRFSGRFYEGRLPEQSEGSALAGTMKIEAFLFPFDASKGKRKIIS